MRAIEGVYLLCAQEMRKKVCGRLHCGNSTVEHEDLERKRESLSTLICEMAL